jgi:GAF domain-containing protein
MAETTLDLRHAPKDQAYAQLHAQIIRVLIGIDDDVAAMATMSSMIHHAFGYLWTGFYRVVSPDLLRIGPYQGTVGCLEIQFGRGVCGTAAAEQRSVVVPDVRRFPGHIACDDRARSEIVVPVYDRAGALIAVLDVDSARTSTFTEQDREGLENIVSWFAGRGRS